MWQSRETNQPKFSVSSKKVILQMEGENHGGREENYSELERSTPWGRKVWGKVSLFRKKKGHDSRKKKCS